MLRNVATALIITFGVLLMTLGFAFALDYFDLLNRECCQSSVIQEAQFCPLVVESVTATPTAVICECNCVTETPVIFIATPTLPPTATRPSESNSTPEASSIPESSPTDISPEPTDKPKCNRGLGNGSEGCDPPGSAGKPGNAGEDNEPGGPHN